MDALKNTIGNGLKALNGLLQTIYSVIPRNIFLGVCFGFVCLIALVIFAIKRNR